MELNCKAVVASVLLVTLLLISCTDALSIRRRPLVERGEVRFIRDSIPPEIVFESKANSERRKRRNAEFFANENLLIRAKRIVATAGAHRPVPMPATFLSAAARLVVPARPETRSPSFSSHAPDIGLNQSSESRRETR